MGFAHLRKYTSMTPLAPCFGEPGAKHARATPEHWNLGDHDYHEIVNHHAIVAAAAYRPFKTIDKGLARSPSIANVSYDIQ